MLIPIYVFAAAVLSVMFVTVLDVLVVQTVLKLLQPLKLAMYITDAENPTMLNLLAVLWEEEWHSVLQEAGAAASRGVAALQEELKTLPEDQQGHAIQSG